MSSTLQTHSAHIAEPHNALVPFWDKNVIKPLLHKLHTLQAVTHTHIFHSNENTGLTHSRTHSFLIIRRARVHWAQLFHHWWERFICMDICIALKIWWVRNAHHMSNKEFTFIRSEMCDDKQFPEYLINMLVYKISCFGYLKYIFGEIYILL